MYELAKSSENVLGRLYQECKYLTKVPWLCQPGKIGLKIRHMQISHFGEEKNSPITYDKKFIHSSKFESLKSLKGSEKQFSYNIIHSFK